MLRLVSESNYIVSMIACSKDSSTCRSIARVSSSIWTAPCSPYLVISKELRLVTIRAIAASDPMIRCFVWKPTPRFSGMWNCGAAMPEPGRAARNCWPAVFTPPLPTSENFWCGPMQASATDRFWTRSEEHTSELQSPDHLVCRLLLEKKKNSPTHDECKI